MQWSFFIFISNSPSCLKSYCIVLMVAPSGEKAGAGTGRPQAVASGVLCVSYCGGGRGGAGAHQRSMCRTWHVRHPADRKHMATPQELTPPSDQDRAHRGTCQPALNQYRIEGLITMALNASSLTGGRT